MKRSKEIPKQYKEQSDNLIHSIATLADKLYPFITELGDNIEIETGKCVVRISKIKRRI